MATKTLIIANWKTYPASFRDARRVLDATKKAADSLKKSSLIVAPPTIYLRELRARYRGKKLAFAAQNIYPEASGAFTGEATFAQVQDAKIPYALVGHSERRAMGETNEDTKKKVTALLAAKMTPILCVGEHSRSHGGEYFPFVREQLKVALSMVPREKISRVLIAYEPIWAIGGEKAMAPVQMHEMAIFIRKALVESHGEGAMKVKILYGGSLNESNARAMLDEGDVAGLLVGHVSTEPARFAKLLASLE